MCTRDDDPTQHDDPEPEAERDPEAEREAFRSLNRVERGRLVYAEDGQR